MTSYQSKMFFAITVIIVAVILLAWGVASLFDNSKIINSNTNKLDNVFVDYDRHILNGRVLENDNSDFFPVAIMFDNAYNSRPQYGLAQADIIYEALAEGRITRLMAIFDSNQSISKIGPVRSARPYFMDWVEEYGGVYMHVGGSPTALNNIDSYNFYNIDQIGAGEIYFWRDNDLQAPHNVFSSNSNWLRIGELKDIGSINSNLIWNYTDSEDFVENISDITIDFDGVYKVEWRFNDNLKVYQRWQGDDKFVYNTGEQAKADNVIVQIVDSKIVDAKERRVMKTQQGGLVYIFNVLGQQSGQWKVVGGRTRFFDEQNQELKLIPGQTWVEIVPSEEFLVL